MTITNASSYHRIRVPPEPPNDPICLRSRNIGVVIRIAKIAGIDLIELINPKWP